MKQKGLIIILLVLLLVTLNSFIPNINADPSIIIDDYELMPSVFMPGDSGTLKLTIKNAETINTISRTSNIGSTSEVYTDTVGAEFNNIWVVAASDSKGKKVKATLNYKNTGYLTPSASFDITFEIIAEENISADLYFPTLLIDIVSYTDVTFPIPIKVSNSTVDLLLTNVPSKISSSGSTLITFTAVNNRENPVEGVTVIPKSMDDLEFTPNSVYIGSLDAGASSNASFSVKPHETGEKNLTFFVHFKNGDNEHNETFYSSIEIIDTLDVGSILTSIPRSIKKGSSSRLTLEVYNAKTEDITGVMVTPISNATILPSQYFMGAMDPDDVFSASFDIFTDNLDYGNHAIEFEVTFKQGNEYFKTPPISSSFSVVKGEGSNFQSYGETSEETQGQQFGYLLGICLPVTIVIIVLIAVVILWGWSKRRKDK
jgi:hypothetical protein